MANLVCAIWEHDDSGIWELHDHRPYTISKMACWAALDRAASLAAAGVVPAGQSARWRNTGETIHRYIEECCWSETQGAYTFFAGSERLDASLTVATRLGYPDPDGRIVSTLDAVRRELGAGPHLYRYSGQASEENCFVACAFWEAEARARLGQRDAAAELMDELVSGCSDVGL